MYVRSTEIVASLLNFGAAFLERSWLRRKATLGAVF
jgi:hypothetical protein